MRINKSLGALAALIAVSTIAPASAMANQPRYDSGYSSNDGRYQRQEVRYDRDDRRYDRNDRRHYRGRNRGRCDGGNGAVGTIGGGVGGALIGNAVGGGTLGTVAGGVGGALLGRHLDKKNTKSKNGC
ncbi:hypothetical protein [Glacieibacterium sp.]|uniref:hypothetical protein n=1 Tax=Glacieibacterium sp. TaxID=2860237 RepID=UPI003B00A95B